MNNEMSETETAFAETACRLLGEYTNRLVAKKKEMVQILDRVYEAPTNFQLKNYLKKRYMNEMEEFFRSREVFEVLIRRASQWVEHGRSPKPGLDLELQVRLADFENVLRSMELFFQSNSI